MSPAARLAAGELRDHARIYAVIAVVVALTMASYLLAAYEQYMVQITRDGMAFAPGTTMREAYGGAPCSQRRWGAPGKAGRGPAGKVLE